MKSHWHETIQRFIDGQSSAEEAEALFKSLDEDPVLRALYLDYVNLDMALGEMADAVAVDENGLIRMAPLQKARTGSSLHLWRWTAAAAAIAALLLFTMLARVSKPVRLGQDAAVAIASSRNAVTRLALDTTSALPPWMSPTASLLEPPTIPQ